MRRLSSIAVKLESNDTYPPSLTMELIAGNSKVLRYRQSFGRKPIEAQAGVQTILISTPPDPKIDEFDELEVRIHL